MWKLNDVLDLNSKVKHVFFICMKLISMLVFLEEVYSIFDVHINHALCLLLASWKFLPYVFLITCMVWYVSYMLVWFVEVDTHESFGVAPKQEMTRVTKVCGACSHVVETHEP